MERMSLNRPYEPDRVGKVGAEKEEIAAAHGHGIDQSLEVGGDFRSRRAPEYDCGIANASVSWAVRS